MNCDCCAEKDSEIFENIIKKPLYRNFYRSIKKLALNPKDTKDSKILMKDFIKRVNVHREEILNFFFITFLASVEDKHLKKEIIRSIFKHETIVLHQSVTREGLKIEISFESKYDNKLEKYKGPTF